MSLHCGTDSFAIRVQYDGIKWSPWRGCSVHICNDNILFDRNITFDHDEHIVSADVGETSTFVRGFAFTTNKRKLQTCGQLYPNETRTESGGRLEYISGMDSYSGWFLPQLQLHWSDQFTHVG